MSLFKFPGLIDVHVHLREPGATHKEDFLSGSRAAIAGGFTYILDMPNNPQPTVSVSRLREKINLAKKAVCDVGFHFGTDGENLDSFIKVFNNEQVFGLKVYCNHTTGTLLVEDEKKLANVFQAWESEKPILVHAEKDKLALAIKLTKTYQRRLHVCHITRKEEVAMVKRAKQEKLNVTAGVTPHHLFLKETDQKKLGPFGMMKPELTPEDRDILWDGLTSGVIDLVESDHAPHTKEEKLSPKPPFGVPGLETTLGLLLKAAKDKLLTLEKIKQLLYDEPKRIFNIPEPADTYIEFDPKKLYIVEETKLETKCGWSPFAGWELYGKVEQVVLKGKTLLKN